MGLVSTSAAWVRPGWSDWPDRSISASEQEEGRSMLHPQIKVVPTCPALAAFTLRRCWPGVRGERVLGYTGGRYSWRPDYTQSAGACDGSVWPGGWLATA